MAKGIHFDHLDGSALKVGVVVARWNQKVTNALLKDCTRGLLESGVGEKNIFIQSVPGAYEVVFGTKRMIEKKKVDVIIALGCLIKGETMHFEYIANAVSMGIMDVSLSSGVPIIFGVLTCLTEQQAIDRSIGSGSHGYQWAQSAVEMGLLKLET